MTIARTLSGEVIGQVTSRGFERPWYPTVDAFGAPLADPRPLPEGIPHVELLTRDGRYVTVPASSVRLEEV